MNGNPYIALVVVWCLRLHRICFDIGKPCIFGIKPAENILYIFLEIPLVFKHSPGRGRNAQLMKPGWNLFACGNCYIVENVIGILIYADAEDCIRTGIG